MELITGLLGPYGETGPRGEPRVRYVLLLTNGKRRSRTFNDVASAALFERSARDQYARQPGGVVTVTVAAERYIASRANKRWSAATVRRTRMDLEKFALPASTPIAMVDAEFVRSFLTRIGNVSAGSQQKRYGAVASFLLWCWRKDLIVENPCARLDEDDKPWLSPRYKREHALSKPQLDISTDAFDKYVAAALTLPWAGDRIAALLPLFNGLRNGEVRHLRVADVDFKRGRILLRGPHLKSRTSEGFAAIDALLVDDLRRLCRDKLPGAWLFPSLDWRTPGEPVSEYWIRKRTTDSCARAGLNRCTPHGLRGTYSSELGDSGRSAESIGKNLGHNPGAHGAIARSHYMAVGEVRQSIADLRSLLQVS